MSSAGSSFKDIAANPAPSLISIAISESGGSYTLAPFDSTLNFPTASDLDSPTSGILSSLVPTTELLSHLAVHDFIARSARSERAVLHTHPTELTALTFLPQFSAEKFFFGALAEESDELDDLLPGGMAVAHKAAPGTAELAAKTARALERATVVVWPGHGVIAAADSLSRAFELTDALNRAARMLMLDASKLRNKPV